LFHPLNFSTLDIPNFKNYKYFKKQEYLKQLNDIFMRILICGINGFIGSRLKQAMLEKGWDVIPLQRQDFDSDADILGIKLSAADAVINLAGSPIARRWNTDYKKELYNSRIITTRKLVKAMSVTTQKPKLFISTSAIGIYASEGRHTELICKKSTDFIGQLCKDWENEAIAASSFTRTVIFRLGIVLAKDGGAFPKMLLPFKLFLGGKIGKGRQGFSWIHIYDLIAAYLFAIEDSQINGIFNLTSPEPCKNIVFTRTLARILRRPAFITVPVLALKLFYGEGASAVVGGQTVIPEKLINEGFHFQFPRLKEALEYIIKRN
jgi:uncharacterized protein